MLYVDGVEFEGIKLNCKICGKEFEVKPYGKDKRKFCGSLECKKADSANRMREYRKTDKGKAAIIEDNKRHKRPDKEWKCGRCGGKIISARKKSWCNECIEWGKKMQYKNPAAIFTMQKYRQGNRNKCMARAKTSSILKRLQRGTLNKFPCEVCGKEENIHLHHHSYQADRAKDVIPLCRVHHYELHSWDSN